MVQNLCDMNIKLVSQHEHGSTRTVQLGTHHLSTLIVEENGREKKFNIRSAAFPIFRVPSSFSSSFITSELSAYFSTDVANCP